MVLFLKHKNCEERPALLCNVNQSLDSQPLTGQLSAVYCEWHVVCRKIQKKGRYRPNQGDFPPISFQLWYKSSIKAVFRYSLVIKTYGDDQSMNQSPVNKKIKIPSHS